MKLYGSCEEAAICFFFRPFPYESIVFWGRLHFLVILYTLASPHLNKRQCRILGASEDPQGICGFSTIF